MGGLVRNKKAEYAIDFPAHGQVRTSTELRKQGIHKTFLHEFYQVTFRNKLYGDLAELQKDLGDCLEYCNNERIHQGIMCSVYPLMKTEVDP